MSQSAIDVSLRPVTPDDKEFLVSVYGGTRARELAQVQWEEGQKEAFIRWQFEMQQKEYETRYPDARYDVILVDGVRAGRIWVGADDKQEMFDLLRQGPYSAFIDLKAIVGKRLS